MYNRAMTGAGDSFVLKMAARLTRSLFLFCVLVLVLYLLGNFQEFLDDNQLMLLRVVRVASLVGALLGCYCLGFRAWLAIRGAPLRGVRLATDVLLLAANVVFLAGVEMLFAWLQSPVR